MLINYSARLFRRRELSRFEGELPFKLQQLKNRAKLQQILNVILTHGENGISHKILTENVKLDRKSLRKYTKGLVEARLVRREGKNGKYIPTNVSKGWIFISADILCERFRDMVFPSLRKEEEYYATPIELREFSYEEPEPLKEVLSEYIVPRKLTEKTDEIDLERILFDFSNTIGGFITYVLIQSLNLSPEITERSEDFEEKGLLAQKWIADIFSALSEDLIHIFEMHTDLYISRSSRISDFSSISNLISAFSNVYPFLCEQFESIIQKLPQEVKEEVDEFRRLQAEKRLKSEKE